jgi:SAM-dependent methyltransferase
LQPERSRGAGEWIHGFFDATYVQHLRAQWSDVLTRNQVAFAVKALGLRRGARVLDVPCGFGRHARLLARRGILVVGVDLSRAMLAEARRGGVEPRLEFVRADMRRLGYEGEFDAVVNFYTSFGYFSPRENLDVLRRMARALKPGGGILIDHRDRDRDERLPGRWWDRLPDGTLALQGVRFDRSTGRWSGEWIFVSPRGRRSVRAIQHYVYTLTQWRHMFRAVGLHLTAAWSDYGRPYRRGRGPRLLIMGVRSTRSN